MVSHQEGAFTGDAGRYSNGRMGDRPMSRSYKTRQKAIRDAKRRIGTEAGMFVNQIKPKVFQMLQAQWRRDIDGPPIGTLADMRPMPKQVPFVMPL